ncbi:hypothetical protein AB0C10_21195 [Microbispora amethystogenes]|uniref:hypothetical protein n=1 Tax=Microbispora amethystogenes TaxID=1427754 RepID=UPI0033D1D5E2
MRRKCQVCAVRPPAMVGAGYCFDCWPGGPVVPPPCRRCGSTREYYSSGLCARCHPHAPGEKSAQWRADRQPARPPGRRSAAPQITVDSCPDCLAWGITRTFGWVCAGCRWWRDKHRTIGPCPTCGRTIALHSSNGRCRLCAKQRTIMARQLKIRPDRVPADAVARYGQQLFFARLWHNEGGGRRPYVTKTVPPDTSYLAPVAHEQLVLLDVPRDLRAGLARGFPEPRATQLEAALHHFAGQHAAQHGWSRRTTENVRRAVRILLGIQDTPGAAIKASDVMLLPAISLPARAVTDVLAAAGMLADDRTPAIERWFPIQIADLPEPMRHELGVWFRIARAGRTTPPRLLPRSDHTVKNQLHAALPVLRQWGATHPSLREITRADVAAVLPAGGYARGSLLQGLRSIFKVLKVEKLVFINPTARLSAPVPAMQAPRGVDLAALRRVLNGPDPTAAALAALLAFHAVRVKQLCHLRVTDVRDGRLHLDGQVILLAEPVRQRLRAYLDHRNARWPDTANPHLFIHYRNATHTTAVTNWWIGQRLGMTPQLIRQDRILDEADATHGDLRALSDLFGLSVTMASRYASTITTALDQATPPTP